MTKKMIAFVVLTTLLLVFIPTENWFAAIDDKGLLAFVARMGFMAGWSITVLAIIEYLLPDKYLKRRH